MAIVAAALVTLLVYPGLASWLDWASYVSQQSNQYPVRSGNWAVAAVAGELLGPKVSLPLALLTSALSIFAIAVASKRGLDARKLDAFALALGVMTYLIVAPLAWAHYYLLTLFPAILCLAWIHRSGSWQQYGWLGARLLLTLAALAMIAVDPIRNVLGIRALSAASLAAGGALLLYAILLIELFRRGQRSSGMQTAACARPPSSEAASARPVDAL